MGVRTEAKGWGKIIFKKILQGQKTGFLCKTKNSYQRSIQNYNIHHINLKGTSEINFLGFLERPKFQIINSF